VTGISPQKEKPRLVWIQDLSRMYTTKFVALAFLGTAAAFNPMMQMSTGRRTAIQGAGAAAVAAPLLRPESAAAEKYPGKMVANPPAPVISFFDARGGCSRGGTEYKGAKNGKIEDDMCVKLVMSRISAGNADAVLESVLGQLQSSNKLF